MIINKSTLIIKTNIKDFEFVASECTHIIISDGVTEIGYKAFAGCKNLKSIQLPNTLLKICNKAFFDCENLKKIYIPKNVTEVGAGVFFKCVNLQNIIVSNQNKCFTSCGGVLYSKDLKVLYCYPPKLTYTHYIINTHVEKINDCAFAYSTNLNYISLSDKLLYIGEFVFYGCTNLKKLSIPKSVNTFVGDMCCFLNCDNIEQLFFIGKFEINSIYNLNKLKVLYISENVSCLESYKGEIFKTHTALEHLILYKNDYFTVENGCLFNKEKTILYRRFPTQRNSTYTLPNTVIQIGKWAFRDNNMLSNIILSNNLTYIDVGAFEFSGIKKIHLPKKLDVIREFAFYGCSHLTEVIFNDSIKELYQCVFKECVRLVDVTIPQSIQVIRERIFQSCINLKSINIPRRLYDASPEMFFGVNEKNIHLNFI